MTAAADLREIEEALAFMRSVILSGESWTETCVFIFTDSFAALARLRVSLEAKDEALRELSRWLVEHLDELPTSDQWDEDADEIVTSMRMILTGSPGLAQDADDYTTAQWNAITEIRTALSAGRETRRNQMDTNSPEFKSLVGAALWWRDYATNLAEGRREFPRSPYPALYEYTPAPPQGVVPAGRVSEGGTER